MSEEIVGPIGYINDERRHALISVRDPALLNAIPQGNLLQFAITIETAIQLRAELDAFLKAHGVAMKRWA